ncbi:MAG: hypothetical protein KIS66_06010 [Fimbriimonadaceae bacterium]|nr:hypothetical protein [Fimbriimonadaceae bacterium]
MILAALGLCLVAQAAPRERLAPRVEANLVWGGELRLEYTDPATKFSEVVRETLDWKVIASDKAGWRVRLTRSLLETISDGVRIPALKGEKPTVVEWTLLPSGAFEARPSAVEPADVLRVDRLLSVGLPNRDLSKGDRWTIRHARFGQDLLPEARVDWRYDGLETTENRTLARLSFGFAETGASRPITANGLAWVDLRDGLPNRIEATAENARLPGGEDAALTLRLEYRRTK